MRWTRFHIRRQVRLRHRRCLAGSCEARFTTAQHLEQFDGPVDLPGASRSLYKFRDRIGKAAAEALAIEATLDRLARTPR